MEIGYKIKSARKEAGMTQEQAAEADELGYVILSTYLVLPVVTLIMSAIIGHDSGWTKVKWLMPLFFGGMFAMSSLVTFGIASGSIFNYLGEYAVMLMIGAGISVIGVALGSWFKKLTEKGFKRAMIIITVLLLILPILTLSLYSAYENYMIDADSIEVVEPI